MPKRQTGRLIVPLILACLFLSPDHASAVSMNELEGWLLEKGQAEVIAEYDLDQYREEFQQRDQYATGRQARRSLEMEFIENAFGAGFKYGIMPGLQCAFSAKYSLDQKYGFSLVRPDTSEAPANYDWREDNVTIRGPLSAACSVEARPAPYLLAKVDYECSFFRTATHSRYGAALNAITNDMTKDTLSRSEHAGASLMYLSDPAEKRDYIMSDIDGILHPLVGRKQYSLQARYDFDESETGFREYKFTDGSFSQVRWNRNAFSGGASAGLTDSLEASVSAAYYLPYTYREKQELMTARRFIDQTFKIVDAYDLGAAMRARIGETFGAYVSGSFSNRSSPVASTNYYLYGNRRSFSADYPYGQSGALRQFVLKTGETYVSEASKKRSIERVNLDLTDRPVLESGQFLVGGDFEYFLTERSLRYDLPSTPRHYRYYSNQYTVSGSFSYGVFDWWEVTAGASYVFPVSFNYNYMDNLTDTMELHYAEGSPEKFLIRLSTIMRFGSDCELSVGAGYRPFFKVPYQYIPEFFTPIESDYRIVNSFNQPVPDYLTTYRDFDTDNYYLRVVFKKIF